MNRAARRAASLWTGDKRRAQREVNTFLLGLANLADQCGKCPQDAPIRVRDAARALANELIAAGAIKPA
jgi:hypothetical protein